MATKNDTFAVTTRAHTGTTAAAAVRKAGKVPGVLFGHGSTPTAIELDARLFDELLHKGGKNHLLDITIDGKTNDTALIREVQRHPLTRRVIHADLQRVSATEEISAELPLVTVGVPDGVRNSGGVMDVVSHTVAVTGPANALPESIEVDVSELGVGHHLTAGDLKLPVGIKLGVEPSSILVSVEASKTEVEAAEAAPAVPAADVPVVGEDAPESA
ncbi:MAG: 50S ribosomal protein L25 [Candidatus Eremiobacteraeota bacterium]|nr:50S ribosomal protein L25 [Candidatus Eremiobacteraeota bacterium]